ncbi:MAG: MATE family efflux transporter [Clostridia bacterium]|nr:MATE family efflux transporter [Clostridia bacterium]
MKPEGDFSKGNVWRISLRLGFPVMLAELVHVLYSIVDRIYIGHLENGGTLALTGIGLCFPLITLIGAFANLCSTGGTTMSTIARGEKDDLKAERILETSFTVLLLIGIILTFVLYIFAPEALLLLGADSDTLPEALGYFRIYVVGTIPVLISLGMNSFINAQGYPKIGMITVIIGAVINLILDPLMIFTMGMGIRGAALATIIAQTVSALWVVMFLRGKKAHIKLRRLMIDRSQLSSIFKLGFTGFTFKMTNSITQAAVNIMLKSWGGALSTVYISAMSLINSLREILSLPINGITTGAQSVMSYNYGAKLYKRVSESIRFMLVGGLCINGFIWMVMMFLPGPLIRIFTNDSALISLTASCARIYFGAFPFMALHLAGQMTFVALNRPVQALFFSLIRKVILVTPLTLLLPGIGLGVNGVFWAECLSQLTGGTISFMAMYIMIWRKMKKAVPA